MNAWPLVCVTLCVGCSAYQPPAPPTPREATEVDASIGSTWDAVIDMFAARNIPIRTIERASGIIATEELPVGEEGKTWANCGQNNGVALSPSSAIYNVLVRGDSATSLVKATVRWTLTMSGSSVLECSTSHEWERGLETAVKQRAESLRAGSRDGSTSVAFAGGEHGYVSSDGSTSAAGPAVSGAHAGPGLRSGVELLSEPTFAAAVSDLQSLNAVQGFGETGKDTLTVQLTTAGLRSVAITHYLRRLFYAYRYANDLRTDTLLLLKHTGRMVGTYSATGLDKVDWR